MSAGLVGRVLREKRVFVLPLAVALLVNIGIAAFVVYPLNERVRTGEQQKAVAEQALHAAERDYSAAVSIRANRNRAVEDLARFYAKILPTDLAGARRATYLHLTTLARNADLQTQRRMEDTQEPRPGDQDNHSTLTRFAITMVLKGDYESVRQFLRDIESSPQFIVIDNVALAEGSEPGSALVLTLELSTYYRAPGHGI